MIFEIGEEYNFEVERKNQRRTGKRHRERQTEKVKEGMRKINRESGGSPGYGRRLMYRRSWVRIRAWTFFTYI